MTVKGLHVVRKAVPGRPVRWYVYAWRGGPCLKTQVGGSRPTLSYDDVSRMNSLIEDRRRPDPTRLVSLIRRWKSDDPERASSPEWSGLAQGTQKTWGSQLRLIEERWGETPLNLWNDPRMKAKVVRWRDSRADTPRGADLGVTVLRELLKFGCLHGLVWTNVAEGVPTLYRGGDRSEIVWTEEDIDRFCWHALKLDKPHLIDGIMLASLTGLRRADLVSVSFGNIYDRVIMKKALKVSRRKRRTATMPRIPELDRLLDELATREREPGVQTLLVNSRGLSWSGDGFGGSFNLVRDSADIAHVDPETGERRAKHLHDVRGTFATKLITEGLNDHEVAEVMGWAVERVSTIRRVYVDHARVVVAIGERIAAAGVNRTVNR